jgi:alpha-amylase
MSRSVLSHARNRASARAAGPAPAALASATVIFAVSMVTAQASAAPSSAGSTTAVSSTGDVVANLFEWNWKSVAKECVTVLGPKGYGAVEVAPPQDSIRLAGSTHAWWDVYQPVAYDLNSRMGTASQFSSMVAACHAAGVKVYADAVVNHMAGANQTSTDSYGGASFNPATFTYNDVPYAPSNFHGDPPCPNSDLSIKDWNSVAQVQECQLVSLSDLYTEQDYVRTKIAGYLNSLEAAGVDGFRVDAAKHIAQADLAAILAKVNNTNAGIRPYVMQEVFPGSTGQLAPSAFESNGSLLDFTYAYSMKSQFLGSIANLKSFGQSWGLEPSDHSAAMVANHDLERNGNSLSYKDGAAYTLATIFELAYGYGTPQVYSGFDFTSNDQSPPADANGFVTDTVCGSGWECADRNQGIANMVGWHNAARGQAVANWTDDGNNAIAFGRGSAAWVSIDNGTSAAAKTYQTGLPAGTYCDLIHGSFANGACSGPTVTVGANGNALVTTPAKDAVAIDVGAVVSCGAGGCPPPTSPSSGPTSSASSPSSSPSTPPGTVAESFTVAGAPTNASIYLVGSVPALGNWAPGSAVPLTKSGSSWTGTVNLPASTPIQYKYIAKDSAGNVTWEPDPNHAITTGSTAGSVDDTWHGAPATVSATFNATATTWYGQNVYLIGSIPALGGWDTGKAIALSPANYPVWNATLPLPQNTAFEYKYIKKDPDGTIEWESGANRSHSTGASGSVTFSDSWK